MNDPTENARRQMTAEINSQEANREDLEKKYGQVWDTQEMQRDFKPLAFLAPFINVERRSDGKSGTLMFQHYPRFYFDFKEM